MTQEELILEAFERAGGSLTTFELVKTGVLQYQARLKGLREKLAEKGVVLTEAEPIEGQRKNFLYRIIRPTPPKELFKFNTDPLMRKIAI